jgi:hypothetical protein
MSSRIICTRDKNKQNDDAIIIVPFLNKGSTSEPLEYTVTHKIGASHSPKGLLEKSVTIMNSTNLLSYIRNLLTVLYYDEDPFMSIQFDLPGFPQTLVSPRNLDLVEDAILDRYAQLAESPTSWPFQTSTRVESPVRAPPSPVSVSSDSSSSSSNSSSSESSYEHSKKKHNKHHTNKARSSCCTESYCSRRPAGARQHLFFDENNDITEFNYTYTM